MAANDNNNIAQEIVAAKIKISQLEVLVAQHAHSVAATHNMIARVGAQTAYTTAKEELAAAEAQLKQLEDDHDAQMRQDTEAKQDAAEAKQAAALMPLFSRAHLAAEKQAQLAREAGHR
ncbi:hypothetical protein C8R45DRAFT_1216352 [Mycena sanguinolenta]|nr:hypothetical protein C8R45DRAFT_1216352 [Mycena sanguinolenta]